MWKTYINKFPSYVDNNLPFNLKQNFLKSFESNNSKIQNILFLKDKSILFANVLKINLSSGLDYNFSNIFVKKLLGLLNIHACFFSNWYLNNLPFYKFNEDVDISEFYDQIHRRCSAHIIPEYLMKSVSNNNDIDYIKIPIEDDMILNLNREWTDFNSYLMSLKSKYRKNIKMIYAKSDCLKIKQLKTHDLELNKDRMQFLFDQVIENSNFSGPRFNVEILFSLVKNKIVDLYGYYLKSKLVGFSSYMADQDDFISYYVGYDKTYNLEYCVYPRMLVDKIKYAIKLNKNKIIFGRTANEFKSNFGATPLKSYVYIKFHNRLSHISFKYILRKNRILPWVQRRPFKE